MPIDIGPYEFVVVAGGSGSATVTWTTDVAGSSQVEYWVTGQTHLFTDLDPRRVTSHSVHLTGLVGGQTYNINAISRNVAGTPGSGLTTLTVGSAGAPVGFNWNTDIPASTWFEYTVSTDTTFANSSTTPLDPVRRLTHSITLPALSTGSYIGRAHGRSTPGTEGISASIPFTVGAVTTTSSTSQLLVVS